jgi:glyoxylase-like metal-dependent hydrolase (beta-lactamase superfamily II)
VRAIVLSGVLAIGAAVAAAAPAQDSPAAIGPIQRVRNNLYVIPGQGGNTAVFVTRTGVVLVDTKIDGNGQAILDRVAAVADVPVSTIINTHSHVDHVGSNAFFSASVEVVAHERARDAMAADHTLKDQPQAMPDRTFLDRLTIGRGSDRIELYHFGPGHTGGDAFVVFPAVRAMHAGDMYVRNGPPIVDRDNGGSAVDYAATLEKAVKGIRDVDTVIPGHGDLATWAAFVDYVKDQRFTSSVATTRPTSPPSAPWPGARTAGAHDGRPAASPPE